MNIYKNVLSQDTRVSPSLSHSFSCEITPTHPEKYTLQIPLRYCKALLGLGAARALRGPQQALLGVDCHDTPLTPLVRHHTLSAIGAGVSPRTERTGGPAVDGVLLPDGDRHGESFRWEGSEEVFKELISS